MQGSGWTSDLVQASVTTLGKADSFLEASHDVSRIRHAYHVTTSVCPYG